MKDFTVYPCLQQLLTKKLFLHKNKKPDTPPLFHRKIAPCVAIIVFTMQEINSIANTFFPHFEKSFYRKVFLKHAVFTTTFPYLVRCVIFQINTDFLINWLPYFL